MNPASRTDAAQLKQLNALLETALALSPAERKAWLRALPFEQQPLVPTLASMLERAAVETDSFMRTGAHARLEAVADDAPGDSVGPYELIRPLGHGGMSTVWLARRSDGTLQREVALKLPVPAGFGGAGIARRMARERDILASLEHPRIARLYDAGVTAEGRPWLAMERVEGVPIDAHVAANKLGIDQRLRLFVEVADAVAHAHARLVVHRDLKPGNILVTPSGGVRLLDFGVAQLLEDDTPADQQLTRHIGRPVTPDYAAPEQLGPQPVGTAADVYSLGIVLFELLTGTRPYSVAHHGATSLQDAVLHAAVPPVSSRAPDKATAQQLRVTSTPSSPRRCARNRPTATAASKPSPPTCSATRAARPCWRNRRPGATAHASSRAAGGCRWPPRRWCWRRCWPAWPRRCGRPTRRALRPHGPSKASASSPRS